MLAKWPIFVRILVLSEVQAISEKYLPSLNEYHLFTSVESAAQFIPLAEEEARAHAPFFVFGLWLIKKEEVR
jgi:hypothetical protein